MKVKKFPETMSELSKWALSLKGIEYSYYRHLRTNESNPEELEKLRIDTLDWITMIASKFPKTIHLKHHKNNRYHVYIMNIWVCHVSIEYIYELGLEVALRSV